MFCGMDSISIQMRRSSLSKIKPRAAFWLSIVLTTFIFLIRVTDVQYITLTFTVSVSVLSLYLISIPGGGVLVFFPSYALLESALAHWQSQQQFQQQQQHQRGSGGGGWEERFQQCTRKKLFVDRRESNGDEFQVSSRPFEPHSTYVHL
jgi:hypothetical protein